MDYLLNFTTQRNSQIQTVINTQVGENANFFFSVIADVSWSGHFDSTVEFFFILETTRVHGNKTRNICDTGHFRDLTVF